MKDLSECLRNELQKPSTISVQDNQKNGRDKLTMTLKTIIAIAALFLATGTAHAARECPVKMSNGKVENEAEIQECMPRVNRTVKYYENGHWVWKSPPPAEF